MGFPISEKRKAVDMSPMVEGKKYPYTPKGKMAAKKAAKKTVTQINMQDSKVVKHTEAKADKHQSKWF